MKRHIPTLFTLGNLLCGFLAIASGDIFYGSIYLIIGICLDTFDGLVARAFDVESDMGKELDSLADIVSFGVAPAYLYSLISPFDHWGYLLAPCLFLSGAALRLAKYNVTPSTKHFNGLPVPFATLFLIGIFIGVQFDKSLLVNSLDSKLIYFAIPFILMILMLSKIKMFSLKSLDEGLMSNLSPLICLLSFIAFMFIDFRIAFSSTVIVYILLSLLENRSDRKKHSS